MTGTGDDVGGGGQIGLAAHEGDERSGGGPDLGEDGIDGRGAEAGDAVGDRNH